MLVSLLLMSMLCLLLIGCADVVVYGVDVCVVVCLRLLVMV